MIPSNHDRSVSQLSANPCSVTRVRSRRTPIAQTLSSPAQTPGLHVVAPVDARTPTSAQVPDHGLLQPPQVATRRPAWRPEAEDRIADELTRAVEREGTPAVDPADQPAARLDLVLGPQELARVSRGVPR